MSKASRVKIRRLVLDVLKPLKEPSVVDVAKALAKVKGVSAVNVTVNEVDVETMGLIITIEGEDINFDNIEKELTRVGAVIHSVDQVVVGEKIIESAQPPQART
ncbi:MAG: hypothetical protein DRO23_05385 [Thermoprotei archaeon]|nr:MAG: hypothetical protein DRO23_05385 [Thermoprotei archaeon]